MVGDARYLEADRTQLRWDMVDLESQLAMDHRARVVWKFVEALDLSVLYARIRAREGEPGRPPPDPRILLSLCFRRDDGQRGASIWPDPSRGAPADAHATGSAFARDWRATPP